MTPFASALRQAIAEILAENSLESFPNPGVYTESRAWDALERHYELILRWNEKLNLTRVTEVHAAARKHYVESIVLASMLDPGPACVVDLGSGAGFPGIPVGLVDPEKRVVLLEADVRKSVFLKEATREHANFSVVTQRGDQFARLQQRNPVTGCAQADALVSRAVRASDLFSLGLELDIPVVWISSEAEVAGILCSTWHLRAKVTLPHHAGVVARFHVAR